MSTLKRAKKTATVDTVHCVACGCCVRVCPMNAISINKGVFALVNTNKCVGCGKCAKECPASIISIKETNNEN